MTPPHPRAGEERWRIPICPDCGDWHDRAACQPCGGIRSAADYGMRWVEVMPVPSDQALPEEPSQGALDAAAQQMGEWLGNGHPSSAVRFSVLAAALRAAYKAERALDHVRLGPEPKVEASSKEPFVVALEREELEALLVTSGGLNPPPRRKASEVKRALTEARAKLRTALSEPRGGA